MPTATASLSELIPVETTATARKCRLQFTLHPGQSDAWESDKRFILVLAGTQSGKALALDTPIPTPSGFVPIGDLCAGDVVFDRHGKQCRVVEAFPVMEGRPCYRVTFDDHTSVIADGDHRWITQTAAQRKNQSRRRPDSEWSKSRPQCQPTPDESVVTTEDIAMSLTARHGTEFNHSINNCGPVEISESCLPIPPYTLGMWLGDGTSSSAAITTADPEVLSYIEAEGITVGAGKASNSGMALSYRIGAVRTLLRWNEVRVEQAASLYQSGKNLVEVAEIVGSTRRRVCDTLELAGICIQKRPSRISHRKRSERGVFLPGKLQRPAVSDSSLSLQAILRREGLINNKHIPDAYLFASAQDRLSLLQGLMDSDGYCGLAPSKTCEFSNANEAIARGVLRLLASLGIKARMSTRIPTLNGNAHRLNYRITFTTDSPVFKLKRKLDRVGDCPKPNVKRRFVISVEKVPSVPVRCIAVDSPDHTYLCTESFIPTHNTSFGPLWLYREIQRRGPGDYIVVTPTYPLLVKKALPEFMRLFKSRLKLGDYQAQQKIFTFTPEGSARAFGKQPEGDEPILTQIFFSHAQDPDSLESATAKAAWLDEAGQKKFRLGSWEAILRRLSIHEGRVLLTTTPYDLGWLKQLLFDPWEASGRNHPTIDVVRFDSTENPSFPVREFERARATMPPWRFDLFYRAIFSRPAGLIYTSFDATRHKMPRFTIPDSWNRFVGLDFGGVNTAAVFFAEEMTVENNTPRKTGRLIAYREYKAGERSAAEHVYHLLKGEPRIPICAGGSKSEGQWRREFAAGGTVNGQRVPGLPIHGPNIVKGKEDSIVEVGINRVFSAFALNQIVVFDDLHGLLDEIGSYSRELDDMGEPTEKIDSKETYHFLDSVRYGLGHLHLDRPTGGMMKSPVARQGLTNL